MNILDKILLQRKSDLANTMERLPFDVIKESANNQPPQIFDFKASISHPSEQGINIIAEVKKASPSKGVICKNFQPLKIAQQYKQAGASALSVLTEERFFLGNKDYLQEISTSVNLPTLRKDFIIHPYQIYEARCLGANAFLLIVACLSDEQLSEYIKIGKSLFLDALVEVHTQEEVTRALDCGATLIGINNRNLKTFETSLDNTLELRKKIPDHITLISESGISTPEHINILKQEKIHAVLVGEAFMKDTSTIPEQMNHLLRG